MDNNIERIYRNIFVIKPYHFKYSITQLLLSNQYRSFVKLTNKLDKIFDKLDNVNFL